MRSAAGLSITIADRGGTAPVRLPVADLRCSWEGSRAGTLSCFVTRDDIRRAGLPWEPQGLYGRWLRYEDAAAGAWGGIVTSDPREDGVIELGGGTFHLLLRKRRTPRQRRTSIAAAGALALRLISEAAREDPTWIDIGQVDEDGPHLSRQWQAEDTYDAITGLADESGSQWDVDADRLFRFGQRLGRDLSARVLIAEPRHIVGIRYVGDRWGVENDLVGVAGDADHPQAGTAQIANSASIVRFGRLEGTRVYPGELNSSTIGPKLRRELAVASAPVAAIELTLANRDSCWSRFKEFDTIRVQAASAGLDAPVRVISRSRDVVAGTMVVAAELEAAA